MKVIDILNKIANNEELPLRIKVNGYEYRICNGQYFSDEKYMYLVDSSGSISHLNDEVEIIEEDKKIQKIKSLNNVGNCETHAEFRDKQQLNNHILKNKIDEIIDKLNAGVDKE